MAKIKSEVAPKGMYFKPTEFMLSGKYCTIMTIVSYPRVISPGYLAGISNIPGVRLAIKHIPISFEVLKKMLNKEIADLKTRYQSEKDQTTQERIRQDYESLEQFISMLASTQARIFDFQMHLLICGDTKEELDMLKMQVRNYLDAMGMRGISLMFEQEKALKSIIPIFPPQDIEEEWEFHFRLLQYQECIRLYLIVLKTQVMVHFLVLMLLVELFYLINFCIKCKKKTIVIMLI